MIYVAHLFICYFPSVCLLGRFLLDPLPILKIGLKKIGLFVSLLLSLESFLHILSKSSFWIHTLQVFFPSFGLPRHRRKF